MMDDGNTDLDVAEQTPPGQASPVLCPTEGELPLAEAADIQIPRRVGFDAIDSLPVSQIAPLLRDASMDHMVGAATQLTEQGGRGAAARRLLARDVELARVQLRWYEAMLANVMKTGTEKRIRLYLQMVDGLHRRMLASLELLGRLESPAPVVQVRAHQAAVVVERERK